MDEHCILFSSSVHALVCPSTITELCKLQRILITVPVTSAEAERMFRKLALIENKLKTIYGQERVVLRNRSSAALSVT